MCDKLSTQEWLPETVDSSVGPVVRSEKSHFLVSCLEALKRLGGFALETIFPHACPVCGVCVQSEAGLCLSCWEQLEFISPPYCERLGLPLHYDLGPSAWSAAALVNPPEYDRARAAVLYTGAARSLVRQFKFQGQPKLAGFLARCMFGVSRGLIENNSVLVPVPLHRTRLRQRTYNQAALLAFEIGRFFGASVIADGLIRRRKTVQQVGLKRSARAKNVNGAFAVSEGFLPQVYGAHVVLIDDVLTTGATVEECTRILKAAGARQVDVLVFAIVNPEGAQTNQET